MRSYRQNGPVVGIAQTVAMEASASAERADRARLKRRALPPLLPTATALLAGAIFVADTFTNADIAVAMLYVAVVLIAGRFSTAAGIMWTGAICIVLTIASYLLTLPSGLLPMPGSVFAATVNGLIAIVAIGSTTAIVVQQKSAEGSLRERAALLDLTHDTVFSRGMDDVITYWNRGAEELYGWSRAEAIGKVSHQLLQTSFPVSPEHTQAELERTGRWEGELVHVRRDGTSVVVDSRWALQRDSNGRPALILETNNDITERKRGEEALLQAQLERDRLNRVMMVGEMTTSIVHELNQPIAGVITNASAALRWLKMSPPELREVEQALDRIIRDGNRVGPIVGRVRALARKVPPQKERLDINATIEEVVALTDAELRKHQVALRVRLTLGLPPAMVDRIQIQQVLVNLVVNASEAMSAISHRPRELTITSGLSPDGVVVEVRDTGPGFELAQADRLFHSFYTTKPNGTGMGLAISRSIIQAHGGQLSAAPNAPYGAVFQFTLPV